MAKLPRTEAQMRALQEANNKRRREALARRMEKAALAPTGTDGAGSPGAASGPVVSSAPPQTPIPDGLLPPGEDSRPDSAEAEALAADQVPGYAERLREAVGNPEPKKTPKGKPTEAEIQSWLAERVLRWIMILYIGWLTAPMELSTEQQRRFIAPKDDRKSMVAPLARLFAESELNERVGRKIMDADDILEAAIMFGLWIDSTRPLLRQRRAIKAAEAAETAPPHHAQEDHREPARPGPSGSPAGGVAYPNFGVIPGGSGA